MNVDYIFNMNGDELDAYLKSKDNRKRINEKRFLVFFYARENNELDREAMYFFNKDGFTKIILQISSAEELRDWCHTIFNIDQKFIKAAEEGDLVKVEQYLKEGADIHAVGQETAEPDEALFLAIQNGHLDIIKYLVQNGADILTGESTLIIDAVESNRLDITEYLLENGIDVHYNDEMPLRIAINFNNLDMVKLLLNYGAEINDLILFTIEGAESDVAEYIRSMSN